MSETITRSIGYIAKTTQAVASPFRVRRIAGVQERSLWTKNREASGRETSGMANLILVSSKHAHHRARHQRGERARDNRAQAESHDLLAPLGHHGGKAADKDAEAAEVREAAQAVGHD